MYKLLRYINPLNKLGERKTSIVFPLIANLLLCILSEFYAYTIADNPMVVGMYIIIINVALVIYFAFRDGFRGGFITTGITILYYFYIIYTRHYEGQQLTSGVVTTIILGVIYFLLAFVIGWLKQTIDKLIEREANEKLRLKTILQQLPVGVIITDSKGKVEYANKRLENIMGVKFPVDYTIGLDKELIPATYKNRQAYSSHSPLLHSLKTGKSVVAKEFGLHRKDGKNIFIQINSSAIRNNKGKTIAAASIINDVTQQKELEQRKDDFVNMASHELKTPITSMKIYIEILLNRAGKFKDERHLKIIKSVKLQTEKLQTLVNDLLDVSRLHTGKLNFKKEKFIINTLVKDTIETLQQTTNRHKISYTNQSGISIFADKFRIYQVLTNLLTNAIKYSPEGKEINVRVRRTDNKVIVSVQDFGIGIAKEEKKKIFNRLYQVNGGTENTFPGLGMGLYISSAIIKRHKGNIWVESEKGSGSTFYFSLPFHRGT